MKSRNRKNVTYPNPIKRVFDIRVYALFFTEYHSGKKISAFVTCFQAEFGSHSLTIVGKEVLQVPRIFTDKCDVFSIAHLQKYFLRLVIAFAVKKVVSLNFCENSVIDTQNITVTWKQICPVIGDFCPYRAVYSTVKQIYCLFTIIVLYINNFAAEVSRSSVKSGYTRIKESVIVCACSAGDRKAHGKHYIISPAKSHSCSDSRHNSGNCGKQENFTHTCKKGSEK